MSLEATLRYIAAAPERLAPRYRVSPVPGGFRVRGRGYPDKPIALTVMALTHGNEVGGAAVVAEFLRDLIAGTIASDIELAFLIGNPEAAAAGQRFLDRDLNRSFSFDRRAGDSGHEEVRARALAPTLAQTRWLLDLHQTQQPAANAFLLFPYGKDPLAFASALGPGLPQVTRRGAHFSVDGDGTTEYVFGQGGCGVTLELGACGFDRDQIVYGAGAVRAALSAVTYHNRDGGWGVPDEGEPAPGVPDRESGELFVAGQAVPYPAAGEVTLRPGLVNMMPVAAGELLATIDGREVAAEHAGRILFPKYVEAGQPRPAELVRLVRPVTVGEFSGV